MPMADIVDMEEALSKTGAELFKELYRVYPVADPEDYFKAGQWRNEMMKTDIVLLEAHLRECGAPDPIDLDDVKPPELPAGTPVFTMQPGMMQQAMMMKPTMPQGIKPVLLAQAATAPIAAASAGAAPVVEIRLIALFVAKWKLDPVTSKTVLAKLTPTRRRYVIQNFKTTVTGIEATKELEKYIAECEVDGSWDTVAASGGNGAAPATYAPPKAAVTVRPPGAVMPRPVLAKPGGVMIAPNPMLKRADPWAAQQMGAKRPAFGLGGQPAWGAAAGGKAGPTTVRPPVRPAGGKLISGLLSGF